MCLSAYQHPSRWCPPGALSFHQVVVLGLPFKWTEAEVMELVSQAGTVNQIRIPKDDMGRSRGWAQVQYSSQAVRAWPGRSVAGKCLVGCWCWLWSELLSITCYDEFGHKQHRCQQQ